MSWLGNPVEVVVDDLYIVLGPILTQAKEGDRDLNPLEFSDSSEDEISFDQPSGPQQDTDSDSGSDSSYEAGPPPPPK